MVVVGTYVTYIIGAMGLFVTLMVPFTDIAFFFKLKTLLMSYFTFSGDSWAVPYVLLGLEYLMRRDRVKASADDSILSMCYLSG